MHRSKASIVSIILLSSAGLSLAETTSQGAPSTADAPAAAIPVGEISWDAGIDGVSLIFDNSGKLDRLVSTFRQPVTIPDASGIRKAKTIAEEKAKAAIVRFTDEQISSERVISQVESDVTSTTYAKATGVNSTTTRQMVESVTELTKSYASGSLTGVIVLEQGYDAETQEVWVTVGISNKTKGAAAAVQQMLTEPAAPADPTEKASETDADCCDAAGSTKSSNTGSW